MAADVGAIDPRWHDVTVQQVLQHRGGWDREISQDPMFRSIEIAAQSGRVAARQTARHHAFHGSSRWISTRVHDTPIPISAIVCSVV